MLKTVSPFFKTQIPAADSFCQKNFAVALLVFLFIFPFSSSAFQSSECDEVPVTLTMQHLGQVELASFICGKEVYFSVSELFDFLKIKNLPSDDLSVVEGFITNQDDTFKIDETNKQISYKGKVITLTDEDLIRTRTGLFLNSARFGEIFGLNSDFNIRGLAASLEADFELPSVRIARREQMRANIKTMQQDLTADTVLLREHPLLHFGTATWNLNSTQRTDGISQNLFNVGVGGLIAGGEFLGSFNYNTNQKITPRNQFYRWRYVDNENNIWKQISAGKLGTRSVASIFNPVVGVQITNAPTHIKKAFGTHILTDYTNPEWLVELYINNVLVDYTQADASGFFSFAVPLMYGNTTISLRFYGPWGEEEVSERHINIPFNFLPKGEFQYTLTSGLVEDGENNVFAQAALNYGLTDRISLGAGVEFLSSLEETPVIPFLNTSVRLPGNMLLSADYWHEVGYQGNFSYTAPSNLRLDLNYTKYKEEQQAVRFSYLEERLATISQPLSLGSFSGTSRFTFRQHLFKNNTNTNMEWLLSGSVLGMRANLTNIAFFNDYSDPLIFSRLSTTVRLPAGFMFTPQVEYEYLSNGITAVRGELRKRFSKDVHFQISYDQNLKYDQFYLNAGFTMNLDFSRISFNSSTNRNHTSFSQAAGGSIIYDPAENSLQFDNRAVIGRGSIKFLPFLDINGDGKKDSTEPQLEGLRIHSSGGGAREQIPGGATRFSGLEPYINYHFKLDTRNLDRIAWQVEHETLNIFVNPNQVRLVEIPIKVVGEVAGFVYDSGEGIGGIKINIQDEQGELVTSMLSEGDGYFSYLGLKSGSYTAQVDENQLDRLDMKVNDTFEFDIDNTREGDFVDHLEFLISDLKADSLQSGEMPVPAETLPAGAEDLETKDLEEESSEKETETATQEITVSKEQTTGNPAVTEEVKSSDMEPEIMEIVMPAGNLPETIAASRKEILSQEGLLFKVQIMASKPKIAPDDPVFQGLEGVEEYRHEGLYKYTWGISSSFSDANQIKNQLRSQGFPDAFVVPFHKKTRLSPWQVEGNISFMDRQLTGIGGIKIGIYDASNKLITSLLTEADGNFRVSGLKAGSYMAKLDKEQLKGINMKTEFPVAAFSINTDRGITTESIQFILESIAEEKAFTPTDTEQKGMVFKVQVLASNPKLPVTHRLLKGLKGVERYEHEGMYKYTWGEADNLREIRQVRDQLQELGFHDAFIVFFYNDVRIKLQEMTGRILLDLGGELNGLEGIRVHIYNRQENSVTSVVSGNNGRLSFLGLKPGQYTARPDLDQLGELNLFTDQESFSFHIGRNQEGKIEHPVEFILKQEKPSNQTPVKKTEAEEDLEYRVQIAASNVRLSKNHPALRGAEGIELYIHEGMYKYTVGKTSSITEANRLKAELRSQGFPNAFVVPLLAGHRISLEEAEKKQQRKR